jgi:CDP-diglyceride synthetase
MRLPSYRRAPHACMVLLILVLLLMLLLILLLILLLLLMLMLMLILTLTSDESRRAPYLLTVVFILLLTTELCGDGEYTRSLTSEAFIWILVSIMPYVTCTMLTSLR